MPKPYILPDGEVRELDEEFHKHAVRGVPPVPPELAKTKAAVLLEHDVFAYYKSTGEGWQTRINDDLRKNIR